MFPQEWLSMVSLFSCFSDVELLLFATWAEWKSQKVTFLLQEILSEQTNTDVDSTILTGIPQHILASAITVFLGAHSYPS